MWWFLLGILVGGLIALFVFAMISINRPEDETDASAPMGEKQEEHSSHG